ncbi:MAG: ATPase [Bacteroidetes bacterium RIFCSPHIGHO2_02_FULL_44_7]|nr:MAG: ATPase [Bacteroidetes bacterium RIFCSPHIGHO2_02_FULL_44_7]
MQRAAYDEFKRRVRPQKVLILLGARRVGKTELIKKYISELAPGEYQLHNGEDQNTWQLFAERTVANYKRLLGATKLLVIDEAQKIPDIGLKLKLMVDSIDGLSIIATGSSVFDLTNKLGEPLVGRANTLQLFPLAQMEFGLIENHFETTVNLEERLLFGGYPELLHIENWNEKIEYLDDVIGSNLIRDILEFEGVRKSEKIMGLLRLIAFQVGKEVNVEELAKSLKDISRNTVESYLDLLEKVFIIYKVGGFSRNLRKEVTKMNRWYFYDNGIRNAIIKNFNKLDFRQDSGELWENYLMAERMKYNAYSKNLAQRYFWRTYDQQEIDLVEEGSGKLSAYEFKWNVKKKSKAPGAWKRAYPDASFETINRENYLDFITLQDEG